jgi:hypothetical protein
VAPRKLEKSDASVTVRMKTTPDGVLFTKELRLRDPDAFVLLDAALYVAPAVSTETPPD